MHGNIGSWWLTCGRGLGSIAWLSKWNGNTGYRLMVMENVETLGGGIEGGSGKAEEGGVKR